MQNDATLKLMAAVLVLSLGVTLARFILDMIGFDIMQQNLARITRFLEERRIVILRRESVAEAEEDEAEEDEDEAEEDEDEEDEDEAEEDEDEAEEDEDKVEAEEDEAEEAGPDRIEKKDQ